MANPNREIRIAVMGATGSGKSTFINKASGSSLPVGRGLESCTSEVRTSRPFVVSGRIVTLIDTPGFDDTSRSDTDILTMIAAYLSKTYEHGARLAGVIYMHRISDFRMGGTSKRNFKIFRELCGENSLKNVIIVTNMWSEVKREIGEAREAELASKDKFFKPVLEKGARLLRHDGTLESAHTTLRYLINNQAATLRIQQEIVNEHKPIEKTAAGAELRRALDEQADQHKEEIRNLRAEMEAALRAKDEETRKELQEELEKKQEECLRIEQNSQRMAAEFAAERARLEALILQMEAEQQKHVQTVESLQGEVAKVLTEKEEQETLHAQRKSEILAAKQAEDKRRARELEEERKARMLAEENHQKHLQSLLDDMEKVRIAKEIADIAHAEEVKRERDRLAALEAEQQRQKSAMEAAERERAREEAERVRLQEEFAQREKELEEVKASHAEKEAESIAAKQAVENARIRLLEHQQQARQHEEELARLQREMEETHATREREAALARQVEEDARVQLLAEKHEAKLREEEAQRKQLEDELLRARQEMEEAAKAEETRKQEEAAAAKKVEEEAQSRLMELQRLAKHREEEQRKAAEQEVARARKELEEAHAKAEREAAAAKEAQELERARLLEEQKKREEEHRRQTEEELARLRQLVAQSEEQSARLAEQARQKEATEKKKSQQLEEELTKARERARVAKLDYERRLTDVEEQSSLEHGLPQPGILLPNLPFVVWKAAMTWWGTTKTRK
jgi:hypothetical protein